jgi:sec-independent protein translocase protein TatA
MIPLFGPIGPEILIILLVLVLLFGANQIPQLANAVGKSMGSFKKGRQEAEKEVEEIQEEVEETAEGVSEEVKNVE